MTEEEFALGLHAVETAMLYETRERWRDKLTRNDDRQRERIAALRKALEDVISMGDPMMGIRLAIHALKADEGD